MKTMTRMATWMVGVVVLTAGLWVSPALAQAPQTPAARPPAAQDGFVPMSEVPEHDRLPAAPFLIASYIVVWMLVLLYVWSLWRRLSRVEEELKRLSPGMLKS